MSESVAMVWLVQLALGGGLLLLAAWLLMMCVRAPAVRQRLGEVGVLSALLLAGLALGPRWLPVHLPAWMAPAAVPAVQQRAEVVPPAEPMLPERVEEVFPGFAVELPAPDAPEAAPAPAVAVNEPAREARPVVDWRGRIETMLLVGYAGIAGLFLLRWLLAHAALAWLLRGAKPAPEPVAELLEELAPGQRMRLVMSPRVRVPFSCGLIRPTMVLPANLAEAPPWVLRWVLAHERTHLERRDGGSGLLLALGQAAFFFVPWFWWLRRQVRLCQEYVADAAAVAAGGRPEDYAEFLLGWVAAPPAPVVGNGVFGSSSDLYQRIRMLLQPRPVPSGTRSRRWLVGAGAGLLSLAVILAGMYVQPRASAEAVAAPPPEKVEKAPVPPVPDVDKLLAPLPPGAGDAEVKQLRQRLEELNQQIEAMRRQLEMPHPLVVSRGSLFDTLIRPPEPALAAQLDLPKGQGMVLEEVGANSAAAKAGLKRHDILLELAGKPVSSKREEFAKLLHGVKPDTPVDAVVMRKGKKETIKGFSLPESKPATADLSVIP